MNINIFGSTGIIGTKTLNIIAEHFLEIKINLLCANNNLSKLVKQSYLFSPKFVYLNNQKKILLLKKKINPKTKILDYNELVDYLSVSNSYHSLLAVSGYKSLNYFELILKNSITIGLVSKEAVVSAGHLFKNYKKLYIKKLYPLDSEHFSIFKYLKSNKSNNFKKIFLTASGGPFL